MRSLAVEDTETPTVAALQRENAELRAVVLYHSLRARRFARLLDEIRGAVKVAP